jgi:alkylated DNA repair dioxygenase AlkB
MRVPVTRTRTRTRLQSAGIVDGPDERPDTCVVNVYAPGSWLPPHVDSEAFDRPFWTVSLLSSQEG